MEVVVTTGAIRRVRISGENVTNNKPTLSFFNRLDALLVAQPTRPKH